MANKVSQGNFDLNELKEQMSKIKEAAAEAKKENQERENRGEPKAKEPLWKKIVGIIIIMIILGAVGFVVISNLDMLFLPKNSVTIVVKDENENAINGLNLKLIGPNHYDVDYEDITDQTLLDVKPGDYILTFEMIPEGYNCEKSTDKFTLAEGGKVKLEYKCSKK